MRSESLTVEVEDGGEGGMKRKVRNEIRKEKENRNEKSKRWKKRLK